MSQPSQGYIDKITRWATSGLDIQRAFPNMEQQFRARLCLECYKLFSENTTVPIRKLVKNIAARDYKLLMDNAQMGVESAVEMVQALGIRRDEATGFILPRSETNISNDIFVINQLLARLNVSKKYIHLAMVEEDIDWLRRHGRETGQWQAVNKAADKLMKINKDFQDDDDPQEQMPNTAINITGDVGVVKEGRESLSDEERERLRRKYGLTDKELTVQMEEINGVWQPVEEEEEKDIFVESEE